MSIRCIAVSNHLVYIVPVSHLMTGVQGPSNIIISLNRKIFNYYDYSINYYARKFTLRLTVTPRQG